MEVATHGPKAASHIQKNLLALALAMGSSLSGAAPIFINELHYDNAGGDVAEGVEIAGTAGQSLEGWSLAFYNGGNGQVYKTVALGGVIDEESQGLGALWFDVSGIQNGGPDGLALIDNLDQPVEFISYEGAFTATNGTLLGFASADMGVSESSSTPQGMSLQRTGSGRECSDFVWSGPQSASMGFLNSGQFIDPLVVTPEPQPVPSPGIGALLSIGLLGLWQRRRRGVN